MPSNPKESYYYSNWTQLTNVIMTNLFLYGQETTPTDPNDRVRRNPNTAPVITMNGPNFMLGGAPGSYAMLSQVPIIQTLFGDTSPILGDTSIAAWMKKWGITSGQSCTVGFLENLILTTPKAKLGNVFDAVIYQSTIDQYSNNYATRTYIYNSEIFSLSPNTIINFPTLDLSGDAESSPTVTNFSLIPESDNFDFKGGGALARAGNALVLIPKINPTSENLGQTVNINFDNTSEIPVNAGVSNGIYTVSNYKSGKTYFGTIFNPLNVTTATNALNAMNGVVAQLQSAGVLQYTINGLPVLYGSVNDDILSAPVGTVPYELVGGSGNDKLSAISGGNVLMDGSGNDTLEGGTGNDQFTLPDGVGHDTISDSGSSSYILIAGNTLGGSKNITGTIPKWVGNSWTAGNGTETYTYTAGSSLGIGTLVISGGMLNQGKITIPQFNLGIAATTSNGYLGITLPQQLTLGKSTSLAPVLGDSSNVSVAGNASLQTLTMSLGAPCNTNTTCTLNATGGNFAQDFISFGSGESSLANGSVTVTIPAGQSSVTFSLIDPNASTSAQTVQLNASLGENGNTFSSNSFGVTFSATPASVTPTTVIPLTADGIIGYYGDSGNDLMTSGDNTGSYYSLGSGNDSVVAGSGDDVIESVEAGPGPTISPLPPDVAGAGITDTVIGGGGQDAIWGVNGNYQVYADTQESLGTAITQLASATYDPTQSDAISLGNGNSTIVGGTGDETISVGSGNNVIVCGPGSNTFIGGVESGVGVPGNAPSIAGSEIYISSNVMAAAAFTAPTGYEGATIFNNWPIELGTYAGLPANGSITALGTGNDTIYGGTGASNYWLPNGNNYLDAGGGNDLIQASTGNSTIFGGAGDDTINSGGGNNYIDGEAGDDLIVGEGGNATIFGGSGDDTIFSGNVTDWATSITSNNSYIDAGDGDTVVYGAGGNDTLVAGTGNDTLNGGAGNELLQGNDGDVNMYGGAGNDTLAAGDGNATLIAGDGNDLLQGGDGNATMVGGGGSDTLTAGDGNAYMEAGSGDTTIIGGNGVDSIWGGAGNDLITGGDGGSDGAPVQIAVGAGDTTVNGGDGVNLIVGGAGNDILNAGDGGDAGQATQITAGNGATTVNGGDGIDYLVGGSGDDSIVAGDGGTASNATSVIGGSGNDTIVAGAGYDNFFGGTGSSNYQINSDAGVVNIYNSQSSDTLTFGAGINIADISVSETGSAITFTTDSGTSVTVDSGALNQATFGDGTTATFAQLLSGQFTIGNVTYSTANATLPTVANSNSSAVVTANGAAVKTQASTPSPMDLTLYGTADLVGTGNNVDNVITANSGNDTLVAGTANDTLIGGGASEMYVVSAGAGTVTTIDASANADVLAFATGIALTDLSVSTSLAANGSLIVTLQNSQGGQTVINGAINADGSSAMLDMLYFADGSSASLSDMVAQLTNGPTAATSSASVTLAGGIQNMTLTGTASIVATGNGQEDVITAGGGNDTLVAGTANDTLSGGGGSTTYLVGQGSGNISILNSASSDTLVFGAGIGENDLTTSTTTVNGQTVISIVDDYGSTITIQGGALSNVEFADGSTATLSQLLSPSYTNGATTYSTISAVAASGVTTLEMTGNADVTATANSANDLLVANGGNDTLVAGTGSDTLSGGGASDDYVVANGSQVTTVDNSGAYDTLTFGTGVTASGLTATASTASDGSLVVTIQNSQGGTVVLNDYVANQSVDQIVFADGSNTSLAAMLAQATTGPTATTSSTDVTLAEGTQNLQLTGSANITATANDDDDVIVANGGNDTLVAGTGSDTFVGGAGANTYSISAGNGSVVINDSSSNDVLAFDSSVSPSDLSATSTTVNGQTVTIITNIDGGTITINGGGLNQVSFAGNTINLAQLVSSSFTIGSTTYSNIDAAAGDGITTLAMISSANVTATANALNDTLIANSGNDTLIAGTGNDTLVGDGGATTYSFAQGYGATTIENAAGADIIAMGAGVTASNISFGQSQNADGSVSLVIGNNLGNSITIADYSPGDADTLTFANGQSMSIQAALAQDTSGFSAATSAVSVSLPEGIQNMTLTGTASLLAVGNDEDNVISSNSGNDTLVAGSANDTLVGGTGATTYDISAGDGNVVINNSSTNDALTFDSSISEADLSVTSATVNGQAVTTITNTQGGTITINGGGLSTVQFAGGTTTTLATLEGTNTTFYASEGIVNLPAGYTTLVLTGDANIVGSANDGNNTLVSNSGNDTLISGTGNDTFVGGTGNTTYGLSPDGDAAYGPATIEDAGTGDEIEFPYGVEPPDISYTVISEADGSRNLQINNSLGNAITIENYTPGMADTLVFVEGETASIVTESIQYFLSQMTTGLYAATSAVSVALSKDVLNMTLTGTGNLVANANNEDNVIVANTGNDTLVAGTGSDTFVGGIGMTTYDVNAGDGNVVIKNCNVNDILQFGAGITAGDLTVSATSGEEDFVTIDDSQGGSVTINYPYVSGGPYLNQIDFADGTSTTLTQLFAALPGATQTISAGDSNDVSPSVLNIIYTASNGGVVGNELNDTITIEGSNDEARAGAGFDTLIAGTGASGSYFYTNSDLNTPTTFVVDANTGTTTISAKQGDTLDFGPGITAADVSIAITGSDSNDWTWTVTTAQGATVILNLDPNSDLTNSVVNFADGTSTTLGQLLPAPVVSGSTMTAQGNATLTAGLTNLVFTGNGDVVGVNNNDNGTITTNEGNDTLTAAGANDTINGGSGNETVTAGGDNDFFSDQPNFSGSKSTLVFGGNNDVLFFEEGNQSVTLSGANDVVGFSNAYYVTDPYDPGLLPAGANNSTTIVGGGGNDTYYFSVNQSWADATNSSVTLENTSSSDVLDIPVNATQATMTSAVVNGITVTTISWEGGDVAVSGALQQAVFSGGLTLTFSELLALGTPVTSTTGGTLAAGVRSYGLSASNASATANNLNDYLVVDPNSAEGQNTGDTLVSGAGNDTLDGGGDDSGMEYEIAAGSGTTTILPSEGGAVLQFEGNVTASSLTASATIVDGNEIATIQVAGANPVILENPFISSIDFANGTSTTLSAILPTVTSSTSFDMPDGMTSLTLIGTASITAQGNDYANTITANSGNDTLIAGNGVATLIGGSGDDTFIVTSPDDVITEAPNSGDNTEDALTSVTLAANVQNLVDILDSPMTLTANSGNDTITAGTDDDTLVGGTGNATMIGNASTGTTYVVKSGDGVITIDDSSANDVLQFGSGVSASSVFATSTGSGSSTVVTLSYASSSVVLNDPALTEISFSNGSSTTLAALLAAGTSISSSTSIVMPAGATKLTLTGTASISGTGNSLADTIIANSGNDTLVSGSGIDTLDGGAGNDTFTINNSSDAITVSTAKTGNVVQSTVNYILPNNLLTLTGTGSTSINLTGNTLADKITANSGNDTLTSGSGIDTLVGGTGNDTFIVNNSSDGITVSSAKAGNVVQSSVNYVLPTNLLNLAGIGSNAISLTGNASADTITANSGNDTLTAGTGLATLIGGSGNDTFVIDNTGDVITEAANTGSNLEQTSVTITLAANVQNLTGTGSTSISLKGNSLANVITANSGNDTLQGGTGASTLVGGTGNDTMTGSTAATTYQVNNTDGNTVINSSGTSDILSFGSGITASTVTASSTGTGSSTVVTLTLSSGKTVVLNDPSLTTVDFSGSSATTLAALLAASTSISSSVSIVMPASATTLTLTGTGNISGTGNTLADTIIANSGNDTLIAGSGNDTLISGTGNDSMTGGAGNDTFVVNNSNDKITVTTAKAGNITQSAVSYVLPTSLLNLTGTGSNNISLTGNASADTITANSGNDTLTAGSGLATLIGGSGNDTFVVNSASDVITVSTANAANIVQSSVSYTLGANLLTLTGTSTGAINLTGNTLADAITANSGNDTLTSGTGIDTLIGGTGNDTFVVNSASDVITEAANTGNNTEQTSVTVTLAANVQNLTGSGSTAIKLTGNTLNNVITGNSGNDTLVAGAGNDTLTAGTGSTTTTFTGGAGNDVFNVNSTTDVVTAVSGTNVNTINSSVSYTAPTNVQDLFLTGSGSLTATANSGNDMLIGNSGTDTLTGGTGVDVLEAGSGADTLKDTGGANALIGGAGNDTLTGGTGTSFIVGGTGNDAITLGAGTAVVAFNTGAGKATIAPGTGASNVLSLGGGIAYTNLAFSKSGNNLILSTGGNNTITFTNWYVGSADQNFVTLQVIEQAASTYSSTSSNTLYSSEVEEFSFTQLVAAFNAALVATPSLTSWSLSNSLLTDHLSSSNTVALGGDLAYYDGLNGNLTGLNLATAVTTLQSSTYGKTAQTIDAWSGISNGTNKLH